MSLFTFLSWLSLPSTILLVPIMFLAALIIFKRSRSSLNLPPAGLPSSQKSLSYNFLDIGFAPYGEYWREMRKVCVVELFNQKRIQSFGFIREEEVARMVASISEYCSSSKAINLSDLLVTLTSNIICRAAFG
ncbi:cytochrome P450 71B10-like protein [Cinnamomum micranthum f. kanehirae]|uniref:Cytochrome P450 71B10-like protein n=1 Tax=Cinnamomum micranthum f. kanehirae TaxID=337451 RepID=A0A443PW14_9MAGN|nr:cytochrome P450 71B10-like protein [Cinnamomum micranthum f. kanehirae]